MGVTYKQGKIMKNIYKSFALLCMGLAATACIEENFENNGPKYDTTPGNEIIFSATAGIESGDKKTRTVYGDQDNPNAAKGWIEINWVDGDMIAITSPQSGGPKVGHYSVTGGTHQKNEGEGVTNPDYNKTHAAASLTRLGDSGLQWSEETKYTFYAAYPSFDYDTDKSHGATAKLTEDGVLTGSMPIEQTYKAVKPHTDAAGKAGFIVEPEMRYSFMTAKSTYSRYKEDGKTPNDQAINLQLESMVTALQFDITANTINIPAESVTSMEIVSVALLSGKSKIAGDFTYDIKNGAYTAGTSGTNRVTIHFDGDDQKSLASNGGFLNVTFFVLPGAEGIPAGDLQLQILFKLGNTQMSRLATIGKALEGGKKYIFNDVLLPKFEGDVPPSSWWDTLDPDTILPQVSIPVAGNVFANPKYLSSISADRTQQTLDIESLWQMGVRGFEVQVQGCTAEGDTPDEATGKSLGEEGIVAAGQQLSTTFDDVFDKLAGLLMSSKDADGKPTECLFLICTYSAVNDGYNPYVFVSNLFNYLTAYCKDNTHGITETNFEQISAATTVGDLRGKIAIIIRPGDDERWLYETKTYHADGFLTDYSPLTDPFTQLGVESVPEAGLTGYIPTKLSNAWWNKVMLISDWGAETYDVWDRRYGDTYARAATLNDLCVNAGRESAKNQVESYLVQLSTQSSSIAAGTKTGYTWQENNMPEPLDEFKYEHAMSNGAIAYVQEWMRVIPEGGIGPIAFGSGSYYSNWTRQYETLWIKWPSSIEYKERDIKNLFEKVVLTKGKPLTNIYINVLSGYYADDSSVNVSIYPYKQSFGNNTTFTISNPGKGGNFADLAADLNQYTYDLLSATPVSNGGIAKSALAQDGPWGLVMMDHIKANDVSADLVELIMMNNFKFDLVTSESTRTTPSYNATYSNGGEAISFE